MNMFMITPSVEYILINLKFSDYFRSMDTLSKLLKFAQCNKHVQESLDIIEKSLIRYSVQRTCISFNGGKDCTALLHLLHSAANKLVSNNNGEQLTAFYAQLPNHFDEESKFVDEVVRCYNLKLLRFTSNSLKESLFQLQSDAPHIEAIFIGTRSDDLKPGTKIEAFAPTDKDWPKFMRINPILNWSYTQIWDFIKELDVPYCDLYNQGYSSLGTKTDTKKNSSLLKYNENGEPYYLPAWSLTEFHEERSSRSSSLDMSNKSSQT